MILEIRLENFYSIKHEVLLDFRAAKINNEAIKALSSNVIEYNGQKILKSIGLFGANASGKSNILKAINSCYRLILDSHQYNVGAEFNFSPFKFDDYAKKPSSFSINFIHEGIEYEYSFSLTTTEIVKESLYYYPNVRRVKVFVRDETKSSAKQEKYNFSDGLIPRPFDVAINTSIKTLFLSRASQMDREFCMKLYSYFMQNFLIKFAPLLDFDSLRFVSTTQSFIKNKELILHALAICDSDISDIEMVQEETKFDGTYKFNGTINYSGKGSISKFETFHKANPTVSFDLFGEESAGTTQLFNMLFFLLDVVKNGKVFMLDEFDLSLHTKLASFIIDLFYAGSSAQFLFTSHNTNLIDAKYFRRDQIWFCDKKEDGSTELYSLYDYKDFRENMDAEKGYLQGRFDAIPIVDNSLSALKKLLGNTETA